MRVGVLNFMPHSLAKNILIFPKDHRYNKNKPHLCLRVRDGDESI